MAVFLQRNRTFDYYFVPQSRLRMVQKAIRLPSNSSISFVATLKSVIIINIKITIIGGLGKRASVTIGLLLLRAPPGGTRRELWAGSVKIWQEIHFSFHFFAHD